MAAVDAMNAGVGSPAEPWEADVADVVARYGTDAERGLTTEESARRLARFGSNELVEQRRTSAVQLFFSQFANTMTLVLAAAAAITVVIREYRDTIVIAVIVVLNSVVGFVQEHRAEEAMAALKRLTAATANTMRDGAVAQVPAAELVPGDLVRLAAGDVVSADLRLIEVHGLRVDEAPLTGESEPTAKTARPLDAERGALVADRRNMAFKGTVVSFGRATGVVVATGMATEIGRIATLLQTHSADATPLQQRLGGLGRRLAAAALAVCAVVFIVGVFTGEPADEMFLTAVSLAVAAIPEGLPAVVTVALALGARRMAARRALVRRLPAVETLGSVTVICSDKTGTLTENRMAVERVWTHAGSYTVSGGGYRPEGEVVPAPGTVSPDPSLTRLAEVAVACNDATLHAPREGIEWTITGDPTEGALLAFAPKLGVEQREIEAGRPRVAEIAFDAGRRRMLTVHRAADGWWVAVKGAPGALAPLVSPADAEDLANALAAADSLAAGGYRVIALAERWVDAVPEPLDDIERDLHLVGLVGIADPPRAEAAAAIATCRAAGITPVMITGDHPATAEAVARRLGLLDGASSAVTGHDLDAMGDDELAGRVERVSVYARTTPEQKLRIVEAWKRQGAIVAMTGDGVNDAPALRRADIGVAMGITGTDVSKEAGDMVLADDNFATIVGAVEEGRRIYDNVRRFVRYMLATNSGEVWVMFLAPLLGLPLPLLPAQILWINLVTDGPPAVALGLEPAEPDTMTRPPRPASESILGRGLWQHALWIGLLMAGVSLAVQVLARAAGWPERTMVFTTLAFLQLGNALAVRSERHSAVHLGLRSNPWLMYAVALGVGAQLAAVYAPGVRSLFDTTPLTAVQLAVVLVASSAAFVAVEIEKLVRRRRDPV
ncbi:MAG TPA: HAD-IC family P-type ATPase [Acidimicrobiales bacterium]|nr:HAD-IC family P-type ATPase [Acidimicrobiales bacterium]